MLFNSITFLFVFLVVHQLFWRMPSKHRKHWLLLSSMVFYAWWNPPFLLHFLAVVVISYGFVRLLLRERKTLYLVIAVSLNLANLIFFKYTNSALTIAGEEFGLTEALRWKQELGLFLPLAISFYTFQIIAFLVDTKRGEIEEISFLDFIVFIMFFPQLIAGPIMRHRDFLPQLDRAEFKRDDQYVGLYLIALGTIKKVLIADEIAALIDPVYADPTKYNFWTVIITAWAFTGQVYCDFSGYTDFARGLARMLGYRIPENFYMPNWATSYTGVWRHWHVTLSTWLRDYLYIPLGGNRVSATRFYMNLILVMSLGGIWHGNTYTYFFWGFSHGVFLMIERMVGRDKDPETWPGMIVGWIVMQAGWLSAAVFFRSPDLVTAGAVFQTMAGFSDGVETLPKILQLVQLQLILMAIQQLHRVRARIVPYLLEYAPYLLPALAVTLFYLVARIVRPADEFIYFQF